MFDQMGLLPERFGTYLTTERFLTSMGPAMRMQKQGRKKYEIVHSIVFEDRGQTSSGL